MDDKRFDALTKALAKGANRRNVFKGLLGLGGAALAGSVVLEGDSEAARRPPATRTPIPKCPGGQTWNPATSKCICPANLTQCAPNGGPACCNDKVAVGPGYSECCDNACCHYPNDCVGEEMCCPRLPEVGCLDSRGNCCTTLCEVTPLGVECCPSDEFCPGGSTSPDLCCDGETPIKCACGTNGNTCIADSDEACCIAADCDTPPDDYSACWTATCEGHVCVYHDCAEGSICCPDTMGDYACRAGGDECCLSDEQCADTCEACVNFVCVDDPDTFPCGPSTDPDKYCCPDSDYSLCCGATQFECCGVDSVHGVTRECDADGKCCEWTSPYYCTASKVCCAAACVDFREGEYCCPPDQGRVCPGASQFFCCPNGQECSSDGDCCAAGTVSCGDECCPVENICCQTAAGADGDCCPSITQCNTDGECCAAGSTVCAGTCCIAPKPNCCTDHCVTGNECCVNADCDPGETCIDGTCNCAGEICDDGSCCTTGTHCGAAGGCVDDCIPVEGDCSGGGTCCDGVCCNGTCETTYIICADVCYPDVICCPEGAACVYDPANENAGCCGGDDFCCNLPEHKCKANPGGGGSGRIGDACSGGGNCCSACCSGGFCAAPSECP